MTVVYKEVDGQEGIVEGGGGRVGGLSSQKTLASELFNTLYNIKYNYES